MLPSAEDARRLFSATTSGAVEALTAVQDFFPHEPVAAFELT